MKFDIHLLYIFIGIGLISPKLTWRGWFGVCLLIALWMIYNISKG